jgi:hypothetical protein
MSLKNAALFAFIGTILAALLVMNFALDVASAGRGLLPAAMLFSSFIYALAAVSVAVFFFVFQQRQG